MSVDLFHHFIFQVLIAGIHHIAQNALQDHYFISPILNPTSDEIIEQIDEEKVPIDFHVTIKNISYKILKYNPSKNIVGWRFIIFNRLHKRAAAQRIVYLSA